MPTHYQGDEREVRALNAFIKLQRAVESLNGRLQPELTRAGLTVSQFGVLEALLHLGPMCQKELGQKLLQSGGNITMVINNLEKRNLVKRTRDRQDRRYVQVALTAEGRKLIVELFPHHARSIADQMEVLSAAEQDSLALLCKRLGKQG
ncbi:MAG: hypothetical protein AMXMBFR33_22870 [Candidatus Xenobia bacterium]|jgi:MarR family 2-MHQ and catechol resistance regulon transcriptional repressor